MTSFAKAVQTDVKKVRTENGMRAKSGTGKNCVDMFYKIGAMRGQNPVPVFGAALDEDVDLAVRVALWSRDVREGAGERELFRKMLQFVEQKDAELALRMARKVPELGRWDDLFSFKSAGMRQYVFEMFKDAIQDGNGLAAKWCPRKGTLAAELRKHMGMSPKQYRKTLVALTNVVETKMCARQWEQIDFNHVPSQASRIYKKAFHRNSEAYKEYLAALERGDAGVKVNAGAVYPYEVLKNARYCSAAEKTHMKAQWDALPNYMSDAKVLPMVDVSGSMCCSVGGGSSVTCMDVAISLGLYCADKVDGAFNGMFLTFSGRPELVKLHGDILQKFDQMSRSHWDMNTDLNRAFEEVLRVAVRNKVPQSEMPETVVIFSDMQFDQCVRHDDTAFKMIKRKYKDAGYKIPNVVFWNLRDAGNVPVTAHKTGAALVSGFSPSLMKAVLANDLEEFTPDAIMRKTVCIERYDF